MITSDQLHQAADLLTSSDELEAREKFGIDLDEIGKFLSETEFHLEAGGDAIPVPIALAAYILAVGIAAGFSARDTATV